MSSTVGKIQRSRAIYGILGTIRLWVATAIGYLIWVTLADWRGRAADPACDLEFDRQWGVDTCGTVGPGKAEVVGSNWVYGAEYQGSNATALEEVLRELPIPYGQFTFVDLGSGKGRAILVASRFPFRRIIGVDYSEQLNDIARHNLSRFPKAETRCKEIDVVCADAARFPIPEGPLVIFLFNPFRRPVMREVVKHVVTSFQQDPRRIIVLYSNAVCADVWRNASILEEIPSSRTWIAIYDTQARKASASA